MWTRWCLRGLTKQIFELDSGARFGVAVFYDDGGIEGEAPGFAGAVGDGAGAGDDDGVFGDDEGLVAGGGVDGVAD